MKTKIFLVMAVLAILMVPFAFSQNVSPDNGLTLTPLQAHTAASSSAAYFSPGTVTARVGVGADYWGSGLGFGLYPGIELTLAHPVFGGVFPLSFGLAAHGVIGFEAWYGGAALGVAVGGYGTAHFSFKDLNMSTNLLDPLDIYIGLGLVVPVVGTYWSYYSSAFLGFSEISGLNWFLNKNFALSIEYSYLYWYSTTNIGILLKF